MHFYLHYMQIKNIFVVLNSTNYQNSHAREANYPFPLLSCTAVFFSLEKTAGRKMPTERNICYPN